MRCLCARRRPLPHRQQPPSRRRRRPRGRSGRRGTGAPAGEGGEESAESAKKIKTESGAAPAAAAPAAAADGKAVVPATAPAAALLPADEDFKPSAAIVEVLINFLIRVALIAADGKDANAHQLSEQCVALLADGLAVVGGRQHQARVFREADLSGE